MTYALRLLFVMLMLSHPVGATDLTITFMPLGDSHHFPTPQRLSQILRTHPAAMVQDAYWQGAFLGDHNRQYQVEAELRAVIAEQEAALEGEDQPTLAAMRSFLYELRRARLVFRPQLLLDPDLVRIRPDLNPMLTGSMLLVVPARPSSVRVEGLVAQPGLRPWQPELGVGGYLALAQSLTAADDSVAWVVQPDGLVQRAPFAYWNKRSSGIAPGAIIFIGLDGHDDLNLRTANLLRHRVPE